MVEWSLFKMRLLCDQNLLGWVDLKMCPNISFLIYLADCRNYLSEGWYCQFVSWLNTHFLEDFVWRLMIVWLSVVVHFRNLFQHLLPHTHCNTSWISVFHQMVWIFGSSFVNETNRTRSLSRDKNFEKNTKTPFFPPNRKTCVFFVRFFVCD